jgi:hypothetical protein
MRTVTITTVALALLTSSALAETKKRVLQRSFFVPMQVGDPDVVVAENGPLSLVVRCGQVGDEVAIRLLFASSVDGWHLAQGTAQGQRNLLNLPAGEQLISGQTANGEAGVPGAHGTSALSPDGAILTVPSDATVMLTGVFPSHDCVAAGLATLLKGDFEP